MSNETANSSPLPVQSFWEAMALAVTRPSLRSYERLANDPDATARRAYGWMFKAGFLYVAIGPSVGPLSAQGQGTGSMGGSATIAALVSLLAFVVVVGTIHVLARALGGTGEHGQLAFTVAAFYVPLHVVETLIPVADATSPTILTPLSASLSVVQSLYLCLLTVIAVKAVYQFGWARVLVAASPVLGIHALVIGLVAIGLLLSPGVV